jgi:phytoene dehydrogenase-like protein
MSYDAVVVGAGPNGLAAAVTLARAGRSVLVLEASERAGGGASSAELTLPGVVHDVCSSVHPLAATSPFLRMLPLAEHGLEWAHPEIDLAHPLDDGTAALLSRSLDHTAASLDGDGDAWRRLVSPSIAGWRDLAEGVLAPVAPPRHPLALARFAATGGALPATMVAKRFASGRGSALLAGLAAHSCIPLSHPFTGGLGLVLGVAGHVDGWPLARGGSQMIADALVSYLRDLGGELKTGARVTSLAQLPEARVLLFDLGPRAAVELLGSRAAPRVARSARRFRYGAGVCKVDYALSEPVPWTAIEARRAGTVHLGGTMVEIAAAEREIFEGHAAARPFVLASQATVCDPTRAPKGIHTLWVYCHVPAGSSLDASAAIEAQIERFAPGFRDIVLARSVRTARDLEASNANLVGGDIAGGALDRLQLLARPRITLQPYRLGVGAYLCSASTPPGAGVHGMCGHHAANAALRNELR